MCWCKKKRKSECVKEDREQIEANYKAIDVLAVLAKEDEALLASLEELQESLRYLIASSDGKVKKYDEKIGELLGDLKILLAKRGTDNKKETESLLSSLRLCIAERKAKTQF